jgi:hypothetical protein
MMASLSSVRARAWVLNAEFISVIFESFWTIISYCIKSQKAYNTLRSAEYVDLDSKYKLALSSRSFADAAGDLSVTVITGRIGREFVSAGSWKFGCESLPLI